MDTVEGSDVNLDELKSSIFRRLWCEIDLIEEKSIESKKIVPNH